MKLFIASDIHGSAFYCREMLKAYEKEGADRILFLGDILYHGPRNDLPEEYNPKTVIEMLNPLSSKIINVRGNCDGEVDDMVLSFPVLADYSIIYDGKVNIYATHGHKFGKDNPPSKDIEGILLCGHTHVPACENMGSFVYLNPGSVSIPKENSPHSYMTYEDGRFLWKTLQGEVYREYSCN